MSKVTELTRLENGQVKMYSPAPEHIMTCVEGHRPAFNHPSNLSVVIGNCKKKKHARTGYPCNYLHETYFLVSHLCSYSDKTIDSGHACFEIR